MPGRNASVVCDWRKWPQTPYRATPMLRLGEDDVGIWLFAPRGVSASYADGGPSPLPVSFLTLVPTGACWWMATWMRDNDDVDIDLYVDIVHPPTWVDENRLLIIDLDLDVIRRRSGTTELDDEDEFELHSAELNYPPGVAASARSTAESIFRAVSNRVPPLDGPPARWSDEARAAARAIGT